MDATTEAKINHLLERAKLGQADEIRFLGSGVHNDGYYVRIASAEYCIRVARYEGKRGLLREADALKRLPQGIAPELVYVASEPDPTSNPWTITTYIDGIQPTTLSTGQLISLGAKLARVHGVHAPKGDIVDKGEATGNKAKLWEYLLWSCRSFYNPHEGIQNARLAALIRAAKEWFEIKQRTLRIPCEKSLLHKDIGIGNIIAKGDDIFLIDWEDREFGDPMSDFATGFWDIAVAGRSVLTTKERQVLYNSYITSGGVIDEDRIAMWAVFDKLVVGLFFYDRLSHPRHDTTPNQKKEYSHGMERIMDSLESLLQPREGFPD